MIKIWEDVKLGFALDSCALHCELTLFRFKRGVDRFLNFFSLSAFLTRLGSDEDAFDDCRI